MEARDMKRSKTKRPLKQAKKPIAEAKPQDTAEDGFEKSKPLSREEIAELRDHLEDLNRSNTYGG